MSGVLNLLLAGAASAIKDAYFNLTTLLLNTSSTNGAQNNTFLDSSTNNFTITRNGNTTQGTFTPFSQTGWSNYFGSSTYLTVSNSVFNVGTSPFTIEGWFYSPGSGTGFMSLYGISQGGGPSLKVAVYDSGDGAISFDITGSLKVKTSTSVRAAMNSGWVHIAFVRESTGSNSTKCYINGVENGTGTVNDNFTGWSNPWYIGHNAELYSNAFNGYISNFRMVLGTAVYTSAFTPSTTPLTAISGTSLLTCQSNRFIDNSANAFTITPNGTPSVQAFSPFLPTAAYDTAVVGGSGYFDGSGDYLTFTDSANDLDLGGLVASFEAWVYPTSTANYQHLIYKSGGALSWSASNGIEYAIAFDVNKFYFVYNVSGAATFINGAATRTPNQWYHVAVATDASNNIALFVNGVRDGTAVNAITKPATRTTINVGANPSGTETIYGYICGQRFIKGSGAYDPTQSTITVPTAPPTNVTNTQLLLNYTNAGIYDSASKNVLETVGNAQVSTTQAKWGTTSMYFDGTGDWARLQGSQLFTMPSDFTAECWVYPTAYTNDYAGILCFSNDTENKGWNILLRSSGKAHFNVAMTYTDAATTISLNTWTHLALVRVGSTSKLYVNGVADANTITTSNSANCPTFALIGGYPDISARAFTGYIDDVRITKGYARYTANFTAPTAAFPLQ